MNVSFFLSNVFKTILSKKGEVVNMLVVSLKENQARSFETREGRVIEYKKTEDHCVYIDDLTQFVKFRSSKPSTSTSYRELCVKCMSFFKTPKSLKLHKLSCLNPGGQAEFFVNPGERISFKNWNRKFMNTIVGFLDFETIQVSDDYDPDVKTLKAYHYSLIFVDKQGKLLYEYRGFDIGGNAGEAAIDKLLEMESRLLAEAQKNVSMKLTEEDVKKVKSATKCLICEESFTEECTPVRDHDHYTGTFLGMAHNECNIKRRVQTKINVYMHNGSAFDFHFLINKKLCDERIIPHTVRALPMSQEKLRSITFNSYVMKDTMFFLKSSLDRQVKDLKERKPNHPFSILSQSKVCRNEFGDIDSEKFDVLTNGKSMLPYSKLTREYILEYRLNPPSRSDYVNDFSGKEIDDETYSDITKFWHTFQCQSVAECSAYYVSLDTLLLAEVFMEFRRMILSRDKLDPDFYGGLPSLSMDVFYYNSKESVEILSDPEMMRFFEESIRGGLSFAGERFADVRQPCQCCNKYSWDAPPHPNLQKTCKYGEKSMVYLDVNNLYGGAQSKYLPYENFKWHDKPESFMNPKKWKSMKSNSRKGYWMEVDIDIPKKLHSHFNEYPPLPERKTITYKDLSRRQRMLLRLKLKSKRLVKNFKSVKLISSLEPKKKYKAHYLTILQALKLGCVLKKVHRVISFNQRQISKKFLARMTKRRQKSKTKLMENLIKNMANQLYGKSIERVKDRLNAVFCYTWRRFNKLVSSTGFKACKIISEEPPLCIVYMRKSKVLMNKPLQIGATILEHSKITMFDKFYNFLVEKFPNLKICMTDTDSFLYTCTIPKDESLTQILKDNEDHFDFSKLNPQGYYGKDLYCDHYKNHLDRFKLESKDDAILASCCLRSKLYSILFASWKELVKMKGVPKSCFPKNNINFNAYNNCLKGVSRKKASFKKIGSKNHAVTIRTQKKAALMSAFDDKRYLLDCGIHSHPYGSSLIEKNHGGCVVCL